MKPGIDSRDSHFRRVLVKPGRKRSLWRGPLMRSLGYSVMALLVAFGTYRGGPFVASASALQIDRIVVHGNARLPTAEVLDLLGGLRGESIVRVDLESWRQRLQAVPWVEEAAFKRYLPSTIDVGITERSPMAIARDHDELYLVDEAGNVIDTYGPQYSDFDLPIVDGLLPLDEPQDATQRGRANLAARVITSLRQEPDIGNRLSQIDVSDPQNATVILSGDPSVIYIGRDRFLPKLQSYLQLADTLRQRMAGIDYVDLRFENWVYVGPTAGRGRGGTATRAVDVKSAESSRRR